MRCLVDLINRSVQISYGLMKLLLISFHHNQSVYAREWREVVGSCQYFLDANGIFVSGLFGLCLRPIFLKQNYIPSCSRRSARASDLLLPQIVVQQPTEPICQCVIQ